MYSVEVEMMIVREPKTLSLFELTAKIAVKKQFIAQSDPHFEEYWNCQRDLAELERTYDEANKAWMNYQATVKRQ
jgi:hypothetical protein